jgi:hypothetical protein
MTTALPTIYPVGYAGTTNDFLETKVDRSGAMRLQTGTVAIPASTATSTLIGLMPFNKGCKVHYGSSVYSDDLDSSTNVTFNIGYTYYDSTQGTTNASGFVAGSTVPQTGGLIPFTAASGSSVGMVWTAAADGWIAITNTAATTTSGNVEFNIAFAYDASGVTNP